jgi:uncharacterized protein
VIGKLQMAYDLFNLLTATNPEPPSFDFREIWGLMVTHTDRPDRNAWACGHALTEYWTQTLTPAQLQTRFEYYLDQAKSLN